MSTFPTSDCEQAPPPNPDPPKATLYCPSCGHESPVTGDWLVRERDGRTVSVCPVCREPIVAHRLATESDR